MQNLPKRGGCVVFAVVAAFVFTSFASVSPVDRTVTVSQVVRSSGLVHLSFGTSPSGSSYRLYAARAATDMGTVKDGWEDVRPLGLIPASMDTLSWKMPVEWITQKSVVRFFLANIAYDDRLVSLFTTGNAYIDTGITPDATTDITIDYWAGSNVAPFGVAGYFMAFDNGESTGYFYSYLGLSNKSGLPHIEGGRHRARLCSEGVYRDGEQIADFSGQTPTDTCSYNILLFRRNPSDKSTSAKNGQCYIYSATISKGGALVRKFVPAVKDGVLGMYDAVSGDFFTSATGSAFTYGGRAGAPRFEDAASLASSSPVSFGEREFSASECDPATGRVTLTFSSGPAKRLFLVHDDFDKGQDYKAWTNVVFAGNVPADTRTLSYELPERVRASNCAYRFILADADDESGYDTRLAYLNGNSQNNGAWIDTGIVPDTNTYIRIRAACKTSSAASFGVAGCFVFFDNGSSTGIFPIFFGYGSSAVPHASVPGWSTYAANVYELGPDGPVLNGRRLADDTWNFGCDGTVAVVPMALFARRNNVESSVTLSKCGQIWIYSCYIETNGIPARSFVPCVRNGVNGMHDRISGNFFVSAGTGSFSAGEAADPDLPPEAEKTFSRVFHPSSSLSITSVNAKTGALAVRVSGPVGPLALYAVCAPEDPGDDPAAWPISARLASLTNETGSVEWSGIVPDGLLATNRYLKCYAVARREEPFGQQYDYLEGYGTYSINVGIPADSTAETEIEFAENATLDGVAGAGHEGVFCTLNVHPQNQTPKFTYYFFGCNDEDGFDLYTSSTNVFHAVTLGPGGVLVDGDQIADPFLDAVPRRESLSLAVMATRSAGGGRTHYGVVRVRRFRLRKNGVLLRDMVPCVVDDSNGLWDYVSGTFFGNANSSGASKVGDPVFADRLEQDSILGASRTRNLRSGMQLIFR